MDTGYMIEDQIPEIKRNPWVDHLFRPALIVVMIMVFNISLVNLIRLINPAWRGTYFLAGMFLTAVEAIFSYQVIKHWRERGTSPARYRLAEAVLLVVVLKLLNFADKPLAAIWLELQWMWHEPLAFLTIEFYWMLVLAALAWLSATFTMLDLDALYDPYTFRADQIVPLNNLASRFYWAGALLVVISGLGYWLAQADFTTLIDLGRPSVGGIILNVLIYFVAGLILLSQANLTRLMVRWRMQKIEVPPDMVKQWGKYALAFLLITAVGVFFLPTSYTLGFLTSSGILIAYLLQLLIFVMRLIVFLLLIPVAWLLSFLGPDLFAGDLSRGPTAFPPLGSDLGNDPNIWLEALRSLFFWLLILGGLFYLIKIYLNDHPELVEALQRFRPLRFILILWQELWRHLLGLARAGLETLPRRLGFAGKGGTAGPERRGNWLGLGLSPRQRIVYYYLNILKRVEAQGSGRRTNQTPYEYEAVLRRTLPAAADEAGDLTEVFVQARYGQTAVDQAGAGAAKRLWQRLKQALRQLRNPTEPDQNEAEG